MNNMTLTLGNNLETTNPNTLFALIGGQLGNIEDSLSFQGVLSSLLQNPGLVYELQELPLALTASFAGKPADFQVQAGMFGRIHPAMLLPTQNSVENLKPVNNTLVTIPEEWNATIEQIGAVLQTTLKEISKFVQANMNYSQTSAAQNAPSSDLQTILKSVNTKGYWIGIPLPQGLVNQIGKLLNADQAAINSAAGASLQGVNEVLLYSVEVMAEEDRLPSVKDEDQTSQPGLESVAGVLWVSPQLLNEWKSESVLNEEGQSAAVSSQFVLPKETAQSSVNAVQSNAPTLSGQSNQNPTSETSIADSVFVQLFTGEQPDLNWLEIDAFTMPKATAVSTETTPVPATKSSNPAILLNLEASKPVLREAMVAEPAIIVYNLQSAAGVAENVTPINSGEIGTTLPIAQNLADEINQQLLMAANTLISPSLELGDNPEESVVPIKRILIARNPNQMDLATLESAGSETTTNRPPVLNSGSPLVYILTDSVQPAEIAGEQASNLAVPVSGSETATNTPVGKQIASTQALQLANSEENTRNSEVISAGRTKVVVQIAKSMFTAGLKTSNEVAVQTPANGVEINSQMLGSGKSDLLILQNKPAKNVSGDNSGQSTINPNTSLSAVLRLQKIDQTVRQYANDELVNITAKEAAGTVSSAVPNSGASENSLITPVSKTMLVVQIIGSTLKAAKNLAEPTQSTNFDYKAQMAVAAEGESTLVQPSVSQLATGNNLSTDSTKSNDTPAFEQRLQQFTQKVQPNANNNSAEPTQTINFGNKVQMAVVAEGESTPVQSSVSPLVTGNNLPTDSTKSNETPVFEQRLQQLTQKVQLNANNNLTVSNEQEQATTFLAAATKAGLYKLIGQSDVAQNIGGQETQTGTPGEASAATPASATAQTQTQDSKAKPQNNSSKFSEAENHDGKSQKAIKQDSGQNFTNGILTKKMDNLVKLVGNERSHEPLLLEQPVKQIFDQVVRSVRYQTEAGKNQIQVQLKPEYLGLVQIVVENNGSEVHGVVYVERSEVRQALEAQLPAIHRSMQEQHIKLDHLEIKDFSSQLTHQDHSQLAGNKEKPTTTQSETLQNRTEQNKNKYSNLDEKNMRRKRNFGYNSLELTV